MSHTAQSAATQGRARHDDLLSLLHHFCHELRQPLSELESTAYYLDMMLAGSTPAVHAHARQMRALIDLAAWLASDASDFHAAGNEAGEEVELNRCVAEVCEDLALREDLEAELRPAASAVRVTLAREVFARMLRHVLLFLRDVARGAERPVVETRASDGAAQLEIRCRVAKPVSELLSLLDPPSVRGGLRRCAEGLGAGLEIGGSGDAILIALGFRTQPHEVDESGVFDAVESRPSGS